MRVEMFFNGLKVNVGQINVLTEPIFGLEQPSEHFFHRHLVATQFHRRVGGQTGRTGSA